MKDRAYYLSTEAIVSMALLALLLAMPLYESRPSLLDLHLFKKENDLLLLWANRSEGLNEAKMREDFAFAFPGKGGEIFLDGKRIAVGRQGQESVASKAVFFDRQMRKREIRLVVFK